MSLRHRWVYPHPFLMPLPVPTVPQWPVTCETSTSTPQPSASSASGQILSKLNPSSFRVGCRPWSSSGNSLQIPSSQFLPGRAPSQPHSAHPLPAPGKGCPPAVPPPSASCPWRPVRCSLALQPFGKRTVSTWSAHLRTAAAEAGLSPCLECIPSSLPRDSSHSPWDPPRPTCTPGSQPQGTSTRAFTECPQQPLVLANSFCT